MGRFTGGNGPQIGPQGIPNLGNAPITHEELNKRRAMEFEIVMVKSLQDALVAAGDLVNVTSGLSQYEGFQELPGREERHKKALAVVADLQEAQLRYLVSFRSKLRECELLKHDKTMKFTDLGEVK